MCICRSPSKRLKNGGALCHRSGLARWWKYVQELLADIFQTDGSEPPESDSKPARAPTK